MIWPVWRSKTRTRSTCAARSARSSDVGEAPASFFVVPRLAAGARED